MYNRYIPQPDGSFRRSAMQDRAQRRPEPPRRPPCPPEPPPPAPPPVQENCPRREKAQHAPAGSSVGSFLKQLLPKDFDTSDLLIVLLLLLMAGDCPEEQNTALLTLALYLFM